MSCNSTAGTVFGYDFIVSSSYDTAIAVSLITKREVELFYGACEVS
jgi:hypothetical protein